jgi:hypothetical protein
VSSNLNFPELKSIKANKCKIKYKYYRHPEGNVSSRGIEREKDSEGREDGPDAEGRRKQQRLPVEAAMDEADSGLGPIRSISFELGRNLRTKHCQSQLQLQRSLAAFKC